jgi:hypothetical protein
MATLTDVLGFAESVSINDQRFVGQVISRNQRIATSEIITVVPFQFEFKPNNYLQYSKNRDLLANLRYFDKSLTQYLNFSATGWVNYIDYQGDMTNVQISACQWQTSSAAKNLVLGSLPSTVVLDPTAYIVKAGDFCQAGLYSYIATEDVLRGTGSTVTIPVHRNLINGPLGSVINAVIGQYGTTVSMGGDTYTGITFPVILQQYPAYTLVPIANDSYIAWNNSFKAFEAVL